MSAHPCKILIAARADEHEAIRAEFKDGNFDLQFCESAALLLASLTTTSPDMVVCDAHLPDMEGRELCLALQSLPQGRGLPFILLGSCDSLDEKSRALAVSVAGVVPMPLRKFELLNAVNHLRNTREEGTHYRVLIIEDDDISIKLLTSALGGLNFDLHLERTLASAESYLQDHAADLIYLDHHLPDGLGIDLCRRLKDAPATRHIPIIGMSSDKDLALAFIDAGAEDYLPKPYLKAEVVVRTRKELKRVQMTRELNALVESEKAINLHKNRLLGMAAHDIRNPLSFILSAISLVRGRNRIDDTVRMYHERIHASARNCIALLDEALHMSSLNDIQLHLRRTDFPVLPFIGERLATFQPMAAGKSLVLELDPGDAITPVWNADPDKLAQAVDNLLSNAIKYSGPGGRVVVRLGADASSHMLSIQDQGMGIPAADLPFIFTAYRRTANKPTAGESSTGLGLSIVKRIIEAHGGSVLAESSVGAGSIFTIRLPVQGI